MNKLSPAAQAVILEYSKIAYDSEIELLFSPLPWEHKAVAAALRAAADQLLAVEWNGQIPADTEHQIGINWTRDALHVLANELEAQ